MITNSNIGYGDLLGAQMTTLANMIYVAEENGTGICFFDELKDFRRGYLFKNVLLLDAMLSNGSYITFKKRSILPISELYCSQFKNKTKSVNNYKRIYKSKILSKIDKVFLLFITRIKYLDFITLKGISGVNCDKRFLELDPQKKYNIVSGFGTIKDWGKYTPLIKKMFQFKPEIINEGKNIFNKISKNKKIVSVHFRRGDYLILSSLNLQLDYYTKALKYFSSVEYQLVIFSDDIEYCKTTDIFNDYDVFYMETHSAAVDMYIMSLCDDNIIANSSFSFWGAFLNKNTSKKVICPRDYIGKKATEYLYMNGNWYPDNWISL